LVLGGQRKTRFCGTREVGWMFTLVAAAYNLVRLPTLNNIRSLSRDCRAAEF
jgi:hypothetical protein